MSWLKLSKYRNIRKASYSYSCSTCRKGPRVAFPECWDFPERKIFHIVITVVMCVCFFFFHELISSFPNNDAILGFLRAMLAAQV
jgi:hypothetical protein